MDPISLALLAINGLSTVLSNPALGGGSSVKMGQASELLGILASLIAQGDDALDDLKEFTKTIEDMAEKGRPPNDHEWEIMRARSDDAHARLQAAKEELLEEEEPEPEPEPEPVPEPEPEPPAVETPTEEPVDPPEEEDPPVTG